MGVYCVGYVIGESGVHSLDGPKDKLRALGPMFEVTPSTWLVSTTLHARSILEHLEAVLGDTDQLVVFEVARPGDWSITQGAKVTQEGLAVWCERHVGQN